jgi:hypothetical protein
MNNPPATASQGQRFGPFENVPAELIHPAGFNCRKCKRVVRRAGVVCPGVIPRIMFYSCKCGTIAVWEDERQPRDAQHWAQNIELLKKAGVDLVIFNGNKPTPPSFSGIN